MPGEPTIDQVHIDAALTKFAIQKFYMDPSKFVASAIAPAITVESAGGKYFVEDPRPVAGDEHETEIMYGDVSPELNFKFEKKSYGTNLEALKVVLPDGTAKNADQVLQKKLQGIDKLVTRFAIKRERELAALITESDSYEGGDTGAHWIKAAGLWTGAVDPKVDIDSAIDAVELASGVTPNTMLCSPNAYNILTRNEEIKELIRYTSPSAEQYLRKGIIGGELFNLNLIKAGAVYNENAPLEAISMGRIWGDETTDAGSTWALICYVDPNPIGGAEPWTSTFAGQFIWNMNNVSPGLMGRLLTYRLPEREATAYDFRTDFEIQLTNNLAGAMITGIADVT